MRRWFAYEKGVVARVVRGDVELADLHGKRIKRVVSAKPGCPVVVSISVRKGISAVVEFATSADYERARRETYDGQQDATGGDGDAASN
jgi:hypothetical protein